MISSTLMKILMEFSSSMNGWPFWKTHQCMKNEQFDKINYHFGHLTFLCLDDISLDFGHISFRMGEMS